MKKLLFVVMVVSFVSLISFSSAMAEDLAGKLGVGGGLGLQMTGGGAPDNSKISPNFYANVRYGITKNFLLAFEYDFGWVKGADKIKLRYYKGKRGTFDDILVYNYKTKQYVLPTENVEARTYYQPIMLNVLYRFLLEEKTQQPFLMKLNPYVGLGAGMMIWNTKHERDFTLASDTKGNTVKIEKPVSDTKRETVSIEGNHFAFNLGAGAEYFPRENLGIDLDIRFIQIMNMMDILKVYGRKQKFGIGGANNQLYQAKLGVNYYFGKGVDKDKDGIYGKYDKCPLDAEDKDGFQDEDGCPDNDNDNDGVLDVKDNCPNKAEDIDGFEDADGCPDLDNDKDTIPDSLDKCPNTAGPVEENGCPIGDKDGDGIRDELDKCPIVAEDFDNFEDNDGCPDSDNDNDGIPDTKDVCPNNPEDIDGFEDNDGCPDLDNDKDGVPDDQDKCPNQPETVNGYLDDDGCPDELKQNIILEGVNFELGSAKLTAESYKVLDTAGQILVKNPKLKVRIEGHTDNTGDYTFNKKLSQQRADAVRDYLIKAFNFDPARIVTMGYGPDKPIADNSTEEGRAQNRRVEFVILNPEDAGKK